MTTTEQAAADHIFAPPDIRQQTLQDAEAFIQQKRVNRMVALNTFQQKQAEAASSKRGKQLEQFEKKAAALQKTLDSIAAAFDRADKQLLALNEINHSVNNLDAAINAINGE